MIAEINIFGVFVSSVLVSALLAWVAQVLVRRVLAWSGFYGWVWHRHLVDLALFVLLWRAMTAVLPTIAHWIE